MHRYLEEYIIEDLKTKHVFLSWPRQAEETTPSKQLIHSYVYLNFDSTMDLTILKAEERGILKASKYYLYDTGAIDGDLGAKLENTVACALLREIHFIEYTSGKRAALHFLRDKEKHEVDFFILIDNKPLLMAEVKAADDEFLPSLVRFYHYLKSAEPIQVVYNLKHKKSKGTASIMPVHEFLAGFKIAQHQLDIPDADPHRL